MRGKARRLDQLLAVRRLNEDLGRRVLAQALASVAEVEAALARQETTLADAQTEVAGWNRGWLGVLLETRAAEVPQAMEMFLESRREHEQVKQLVENAQQVEEIEEGRRVQASSDDWFLSRRMSTAR